MIRHVDCCYTDYCTFGSKLLYRKCWKNSDGKINSYIAAFDLDYSLMYSFAFYSCSALHYSSSFISQEKGEKLFLKVLSLPLSFCFFSYNFVESTRTIYISKSFYRNTF